MSNEPEQTGPWMKAGSVFVLSEEKVARLPRWAQVALSSRCARRVQPLFGAGWPGAPEEYRQAVDQALSIAERAAATATYSAAAVAASAAADVAARAAAAASGTADAAVRSARAAGAAAKRAAALHGSPAARVGVTDSASEAGAAAYQFGSEVALRAWARAVERDFKLLVVAAERDGWTHETAVPPEFFGPLWPEGEPERWPLHAEPDASSLSLYFDADEFSPNTIRDVLSMIADVYAGLSGDRLVIDRTGILELARAPEEVR